MHDALAVQVGNAQGDLGEPLARKGLRAGPVALDPFKDITALSQLQNYVHSGRGLNGLVEVDEVLMPQDLHYLAPEERPIKRGKGEPWLCSQPPALSVLLSQNFATGTKEGLVACGQTLCFACPLSEGLKVNE